MSLTGNLHQSIISLPDCLFYMEFGEFTEDIKRIIIDDQIGKGSKDMVVNSDWRDNGRWLQDKKNRRAN